MSCPASGSPTASTAPGEGVSRATRANAQVSAAFGRPTTAISSGPATPAPPTAAAQPMTRGCCRASGATAPSAASAAVGEAAVAGPLEIAVVGRPNAADTCALARVARLTPSPGAVLAVGDPAAGQDIVPLLAGHRPPGEHAAAYLCRHFSCAAPTTSPAELAVALGVNTAAHLLTRAATV